MPPWVAEGLPVPSLRYDDVKDVLVPGGEYTARHDAHFAHPRAGGAAGRGFRPTGAQDHGGCVCPRRWGDREVRRDLRSKVAIQAPSRARHTSRANTPVVCEHPGLSHQVDPDRRPLVVLVAGDGRRAGLQATAASVWSCPQPAIDGQFSARPGFRLKHRARSRAPRPGRRRHHQGRRRLSGPALARPQPPDELRKPGGEASAGSEEARDRASTPRHPGEWLWSSAASSRSGSTAAGNTSSTNMAG